VIDTGTVLTLARKELRDAGRSRWYALFALAFAGLALALAWLSLTGSGNIGLAGFGRTGASLINLVLLIVPLMGMTIGALSLAGERERGSLLYLLSHPVSMLEVLLGKYIGAALALMLALVVGFGLSGLVIGWQQGLAEAGAYIQLVLFAFLLGMVSLSLGFLISAVVKKSATAIGIAIFIWLVLVFFGDLGLMGTAIVLRLKVSQLLTLALINPMQIFKMAAILNIRNSLEVLGPAGLYALRTYGAKLPALLTAALFAWVATPLGIAYWVLRRKGGL
jgi:Cu-processing system permease protein